MLYRPPLAHVISISAPNVMGGTGSSHGRVVPGTRSEESAGHRPSSRGGHRPTCGYRRAVLRWLSALVVAAVLSGFAVLLLTGQYVNEGPVLMRLSQTHGVHVGDLFVVLGWAAALLVGGLLWSAGRRDG